VPICSCASEARTSRSRGRPGTRSQREPGSLRVVLYFENVGSRRPIDLDHDGKQHLLQALTQWHDHPAIGKPFPDDARALFTALADELEAIANRPQ
jgi:hypothetical protein